MSHQPCCDCPPISPSAFCLMICRSSPFAWSLLSRLAGIVLYTISYYGLSCLDLPLRLRGVVSLSSLNLSCVLLL